MLLRYQLRLEDLNIFPTTSLRVYLDFLRANLAPGDWIRYGVSNFNHTSSNPPYWFPRSSLVLLGQIVDHNHIVIVLPL